MNCTLRVCTSARTFILKQSRPWVEKYKHIPAPWDRALEEARFYGIARREPALAADMPELLGVDADARLLCLEDLGDAKDFTSVYAGDAIREDELRALLSFLATLHSAFRGDPAAIGFSNVEMRALNHQHIFVIPLDVNNGLDLDGITPGLKDAARQLLSDSAYLDVARKLGASYLAEGESLLHGDFFPGSWLRTGRGVKIIDPEFGFFGCPEFDVGVMIGHLYLSGNDALVDRAVSLYASAAAIEKERALQFAGIEIMRRLIGVAQLPLTMNLEGKLRLLSMSRTLVVR